MSNIGFETFFERQVLANGKKGDLLILLSTGGGNLDENISTNNNQYVGTEIGLIRKPHSLNKKD